MKTINTMKNREDPAILHTLKLEKYKKLLKINPIALFQIMDFQLLLLRTLSFCFFFVPLLPYRISRTFCPHFNCEESRCADLQLGRNIFSYALGLYLRVIFLLFFDLLNVGARLIYSSGLYSSKYGQQDNYYLYLLFNIDAFAKFFSSRHLLTEASFFLPVTHPLPSARFFFNDSSTGFSLSTWSIPSVPRYPLWWLAERWSIEPAPTAVVLSKTSRGDISSKNGRSRSLRRVSWLFTCCQLHRGLLCRFIFEALRPVLVVVKAVSSKTVSTYISTYFHTFLSCSVPKISISLFWNAQNPPDCRWVWRMRENSSPAVSVLTHMARE